MTRNSHIVGISGLIGRPRAHPLAPITLDFRRESAFLRPFKLSGCVLRHSNPGESNMKRFSMLASVFVAFVAAVLPAAANAQPFQLVEATLDDIQAQYREGELRPEDVVRMYLDRIAAYDRSNAGQPLNHGVGQQPLNSFMHVNEHAIRDARRLGDDFGDSDEGEGEGGDDGRALFGIPVIIK